MMEAAETGKPLPKGTDYQRGRRYLMDTLRDAVFARDGHKCRFCGRGIKEGAVLGVHHVGFWKGDRSNRMANLAAVCLDRCHIQTNHKPGGMLWGIEPAMGTLRSVAFMNTVRFYIFSEIKRHCPGTHMTYGTVTKHERRIRNIEKSHANDAYAMGMFHPKHRCRTAFYEKRRRNNRILEKFYDAKYVDVRDGKVKKAMQLGSGRTNRKFPRRNDQNERVFRGEKKSCGRRSIRRSRYAIQPGDRLSLGKAVLIAKGVHCNGTRVLITEGTSIAIKKVRIHSHIGGWRRTG